METLIKFVYFVSNLLGDDVVADVTVVNQNGFYPRGLNLQSSRMTLNPLKKSQLKSTGSHF